MVKQLGEKAEELILALDATKAQHKDPYQSETVKDALAQFNSVVKSAEEPLDKELAKRVFHKIIQADLEEGLPESMGMLHLSDRMRSIAQKSLPKPDSNTELFLEAVKGCGIDLASYREVEGGLDALRAVSPLIQEHFSIEDVSKILGIAAVLKIMEGLKEEEVEAIFKAASPLIKRGMNGEQVAYSIGALSQVKEKEVEPIFEAASPLLKKGMNGEQVVYTIGALSQIKEEDREGVCIEAAFLIKEEMSGQERLDIIKGLGLVKGDRREVREVTESLVKGKMEKGGVAYLLGKVGKIKEDRGELSRVVAPLIEEGMDSKKISGVLSVVSKIPKDKRESYCKAMAPLVGKAEGLFDNGLSAVLKYAFRDPDLKKAFEENKLEEIATATTLLLPKKTTVDRISSFLKAVETIKENRVEICSAAASLIGNGIGEKEAVEILNIVKEINQKDRKRICETVDFLLGEGVSGRDIVKVLTRVKDLGGADREEVCSAAAHLMKKGMSGDEIIFILGKVESLTEDREKICEAALPFIKAGMRGIEIGSIIWGINQVKEENRPWVFEKAASFIKDSSTGIDIGYILMGIGTLETDDKEGVIKATESLIKEGMSGEDVRAISSALCQIEDRDRIIQIAAPLLNERIDAEAVGMILFNISFTKEEDRSKVVEEVVKFAPGETDGLKVWIIIDAIKGMDTLDGISREKVIEGIKDALQIRLTKLMADERHAKLVMKLLDVIDRNQVNWNIPDEDPLINLAVIARTQVDPNVRGEDNMYTVHRMLQEKRKEVVSPDTTHVKVEGVVKDFDYKGLVQKSGGVKPTLYRELLEVPLNIFTTLFEDLRKRIEESSGAKKAEILVELEGYSDPQKAKVFAGLGEYKDFTFLKRSTTASDRRIQFWLKHPKGQEDKEAPRLMVEMYSIVDALQKTSNKVEEGDVLSPRERFLVSIASSIANCRTGQDDGIHGVYQLLPKKKEVGEAQGYETVEEGRVIACLQPLFKEQVDRATTILDSDNDLMKQLAPGELAREEFPHQSQYVKNLLVGDLSLEYTLTIDFHGEYADLDLRAMSKEEVLKAFYQYYADDLIKNLVPKVAEKINEGIRDMNSPDEALKKPAAALYNAVSDVLGTEYFTLNEDTNAVEMTSEGALPLLEKIGLFKEVS